MGEMGFEGFLSPHALSSPPELLFLSLPPNLQLTPPKFPSFHRFLLTES